MIKLRLILVLLVTPACLTREEAPEPVECAWTENDTCPTGAFNIGERVELSGGTVCNVVRAVCAPKGMERELAVSSCQRELYYCPTGEKNVTTGKESESK